MRYLILGAGYVGRSFMRAQPDLKNNFTATTTSSKHVVELLQIAAQVEIFCHPSRDRLLELVSSADVIVVCFAPKDGDASSYLTLAEDLYAVISSLKERKYLLYTSSTFVYAGVSEDVADETIPLRPSDEKAKILVKTEEALLSLQSDVCDVCVLRLGGIFGPERDLVSRAKRMSGKILAGTGDEPTNHIHVDDVVGFSMFCIERRLAGIFNVVMPFHPSRNQLYGGLCKELGIKEPIFSSEMKIEHGCGVVVSGQKLSNRGYMLKHTHLH